MEQLSSCRARSQEVKAGDITVAQLLDRVIEGEGGSEGEGDGFL